MAVQMTHEQFQQLLTMIGGQGVVEVEEAKQQEQLRWLDPYNTAAWGRIR